MPVTFNWVAKPGTKISDVKIVSTHPTAYAQCRGWLTENLAKHSHIPATSTAAAAVALLEAGSVAQAAIAAKSITAHYKLTVLAKNIGDNKNAQTRFILPGHWGQGLIRY